MNVTARMVCESALEAPGFTNDECQISVKMHAIWSEHPEASNYSKYTPWSEYTMQITNPAIKGFFKPGEVYDILIVPHVADAPAPDETDKGTA